jgi:hypothetical protein
MVSGTPLADESEVAKRVRFNAAMFLGDSSQAVPVPPSLESDAVGADILEYIYGPNQTKQEQWVFNFTNVVDSWIPFIPLDELHTILLNESSQLSAEDVLLLACIKLNSDALPENQPLNKQYLAVKSSFLTMEIYGTLSIRLLQALLLLLLYEFGHGIFPSAYTTLGGCVRYLGALGIEAKLGQKDTNDWIDLEQKRRLWWSVYVMERLVNSVLISSVTLLNNTTSIIALGCPQHPLLLREPDEAHILPSDDASWKQSVLDSELPHPGASMLTNYRAHHLTPT